MTAAASPFDAAFVASLPRLEIAALRASAREGETGRRRAERGGRVEFAEHRPYVAGDDARLIDWPAYARTGRLHVKEFERREERSLLAVVDDSASMALHGKLEAAQRLAYAIAYFALAGGHRVRAAFAAEGSLRASSEVAGRARIRDVADFLVGARGAGTTRLAESLRRLPPAARGHRMLVVLSDLWAEDDGRAALARRSDAGDDVVVVHVRAADDLALPEGPVVAEDAETGERRLLEPSAASAAAHDAAAREERWLAFASRHRLRYVPVDAALPTEDLLLGPLRSAGVVR